MKKHFLIILLPFLLALALVTVALAAAQNSTPGAPDPLPGAQSSAHLTGDLPAATGSQNDRAWEASQGQPEDAREASIPSNSAMIPGFLRESGGTGMYAPLLPEDAWRQPASPTDLGAWDSNTIYNSTVITDSGALKMWYSGVDFFGVGRIGYAESVDGIAWVKPIADPVLDLGAQGEWDDKGVGQASVIKTGSLYQMWYFGVDQNDVKQIGYATSSDGLSWTKYAGNPVLTVGAFGDWDETEVGGPRVIFDSVTYHLWYHGYSGTCCDSIGYATSPDGVNWTKYAGNPVFGPGAPGEWDDSFIFFTSVLSDTDELHMWYSVDGGTGIGYVTSTDGINWTRSLPGPVLTQGDPGEWDENYIFAPMVIEEHGLYRMWYIGSDANWRSRVGYATSPDGETWTKSASNPALEPSAPGLVLVVNYAHDWVVARSVANTPLTVTVEGKGWVSGMTDGDGEFRSWDWLWSGDNPPDIVPGDVMHAETPESNTEVNPVGSIDGVLDANTDTIAGAIHAPFGALTLTVRCEVWVENGPPAINLTGIPADGGSYSCDFGAEGWDIQFGQMVAVIYIEPDGDEVMNIFEAPWKRVNYAHDWVGANYPAGHTFWITVTNGTGEVKATAEIVSSPNSGWGGDGFESNNEWLPQHPNIEEGDWVYFTADTGYNDAIQVGVITGTVVADNDNVSGRVHAGWFTEDLAIECHPWGAPGGVPGKNSTAGPDGEPPYACQWDPLTEWDVQPGQEIAVMYLEPDGDRVINAFQEPKLNIRTNIGHDWVEGNFEAGHTMWITLTNSLGEVKATASGVTGPIEWWGGQSGFSTNANVPWQGPQPNIESGDWVYARMDNGLYAESSLGIIDSSADVDLDTVNGVIYAPFTEPLHVDCGIWEETGPGLGVDGVEPYGGMFTCDFAGQWDIIPGNQIGVSYNEPDGDQVIDMAYNPAPHLHIWTWANGQPASGSNLVLIMQYLNNGDAPTEDGYITATLGGGLSYLGDTSGLPLSGTGVPGDPLVWELGALQPNPYSDTRFYLFVQVTAAVGEWVTNTVHIDNGGAYDQDDPWEKDSQWSGQVVDNNTDLTLGKGAWTWDPVPGSQFVYNVSICNKGSTDSAEVVVTDTLPLSTTLVSWWGQQPGWVEESFSAHELVVSRLSFQGYACSEVYLRVELDAGAWQGMELHNVADVFTSYDSDLSDNHTEIWHNVGAPHANLSVHKEWNWGELTPGGEIRYNISYSNNGNLPAENVFITETLPASTTFVSAFWYDEAGAHPFLPALVTDEIVVWEIGALDNGYGLNFELALDIDPQAMPGLELVNTADITRLQGEDNYDDNTSTWTETLYDHGPNLRVRKSGDWHGYGEGHNAWYNIIVENVGDVAAEHVTLTDTLPVSFTLDGDPNTDWSQVENYVRNDAEGWFSFTFSYLHPNWRRDVNLNVVNPSPDPVPGGLFFTNQAEITSYEGEPTYADNFTAYTLASGPDLYVEKSLVAGEILPDEEVTFSLAFGNQQVGHAGWWNLQGTAWLTDTLPAGTEFITASLRWCGGGDWCPVEPVIQGDDLTWQLWELGVGSWNEIYLTVRLPDTLTGMDTVTNQALIASDQPEVDLEPDYANNTSVYQADVMLPYFEVDKVYESSAVAGTLVTYTLTVDNPGHADGSGLVVFDQRPGYVTYISGGSYDPSLGEITWPLPVLASGDSADVSFVGLLTCEAGQVVDNNMYRVLGSDQNVASDWGAPVTFTVAAPAISASFEASSLTAVVGETVYFTATAATNGTALAYAWDYDGDGSSSGSWFDSHAFSAAGSYVVTLTVTDGCGYIVEYSLVVEVSASTQAIYLPLVRK